MRAERGIDSLSDSILVICFDLWEALESSLRCSRASRSRTVLREGGSDAREALMWFSATLSGEVVDMAGTLADASKRVRFGDGGGVGSVAVRIV